MSSNTRIERHFFTGLVCNRPSAGSSRWPAQTDHRGGALGMGCLKKIGRNHPHRIKPSWFWQTMECIGSFCMVDWGMFCYIIVGFLVRINVVNMLVY